MYDFQTKNIKNTQSYKKNLDISPIINANFICKLVKIISPYVMHMIAPDIILYHEKYTQKLCYVYVSIWYVV